MSIIKNWRIFNALIWASMMIIVAILTPGASEYLILVMTLGYSFESMLLEKMLKEKEKISPKNC